MSTRCSARRPKAELADHLLDGRIGPIPPRLRAARIAVRSRCVRARGLAGVPGARSRPALRAPVRVPAGRRHAPTARASTWSCACWRRAPRMRQSPPAPRSVRMAGSCAAACWSPATDDPGQASLLARPLRVEERIVDFVLGSDRLDARLTAYAQLFDTDDGARDWALPHPVLDGLVRLLGQRGVGRLLYLYGPVGAGKRVTARAACAAANRACCWSTLPPCSRRWVNAPPRLLPPPRARPCCRTRSSCSTASTLC